MTAKAKLTIVVIALFFSGTLLQWSVDNSVKTDGPGYEYGKIVEVEPLWSSDGGGDHGWTDWTASDGETIGGVHTNISTFIIPLGVTVFVKQYLAGSGGKVEINADRIFVIGAIDGNQRGYTGGVFGSGGASGAGGGSGKGGLNGGTDGSFGQNNINGAGGGGGGGGGGYGGAGAPGGNGGFSAGVGGTGGGGGSARGTGTGYDIDMGSGAGGGGGAGGTGVIPGCPGGDSGSSGTDGTRGGGAMLLNASYIRVFGSILMNGGTGGPGGPAGACNIAGTGGGGGGGSGGGIMLYGTTVDISGGTLRANGGMGAAPGPGANPGGAGGQGGGGRIKIFYYYLNTAGSTRSVTGANPGSNIVQQINPKPEKPTLYIPQNSLHAPSLPTFQLNTTDANGNTLQYKIELNTTNDFKVPLKTFDQVASSIGWSASSYPSGEMAYYAVQAGDELSHGTTYFWRAFAFDGTSWSVPSQIHSFTVDSIRPSLSGQNPGQGSYATDAQQIISIDIGDTDSGIDESVLDISVEGTHYNTSSPAISWDWTTLAFDPYRVGVVFADGQVVDVTVNATDNASNQNETSWSFTVDFLGPVTTLLLGNPKYVTGTTIYFNESTTFILSTDDGLGIGIGSTWYRIWEPSSGWTGLMEYSSPFAIAGPNGPRYLEYNSTDLLGNQETVLNYSSISGLYLDDLNPFTIMSIGQPQYVSGPDTFFRMTTPFVLNSSDNSGSGIADTRYRIWSSSAGWTGLTQYTVPFTISGTDGIRYVEYESYDNIGNLEVRCNYSSISDLYLDNTPPASSFSVFGQEYSSGGQTYITSASMISLSGSDASGVRGIWFRIDGGAWTEYTGPFSIATQGSHTVTYNSTDNLGQSESSIIKTLIVDNTPPSTSMTIGTPNYGSSVIYANSSTQFTLTASDSSSGLNRTWYRFDDGSFISYTGPFTLSGLQDGSHTVLFYSEDNVGNAEGIMTKLVFLDNQSPIADAGKDTAALVGTTVSFDGSGSSDNSGSILGYEWAFLYSGLPVILQGKSQSYNFNNPGTYEVTLTVTDLLGYTGSDTTWVNVTQPPDSGEDSDGDLLPDSWELEKFGTLAQNATGDPDSDGLNNLQEYSLSTEPSDDDTDNDGLKDGSDPNPLVAEKESGSTTTEVVPVWVWVVIVVLIILLVVMTILYAIKGKGKRVQEQEPPMQPQQPPLPPPPPWQ